MHDDFMIAVAGGDRKPHPTPCCDNFDGHEIAECRVLFAPLRRSHGLVRRTTIRPNFGPALAPKDCDI
jgi:hypothetical protein